MPTSTVTPEAFVIAWQTSPNVATVAARVGLKAAQVKQRAKDYRNMGVPLKLFGPSRLGAGGRPVVIDWPALALLARTLAPCVNELGSTLAR